MAFFPLTILKQLWILGLDNTSMGLEVQKVTSSLNSSGDDRVEVR